MINEYMFPSTESDSKINEDQNNTMITSFGTNQINIDDEINNQESDLNFFVNNQPFLFQKENEEMHETTNLTETDYNENFKYINDDYIISTSQVSSPRPKFNRDVSKALRDSFNKTLSQENNINVFNNSPLSIGEQFKTSINTGKRNIKGGSNDQNIYEHNSDFFSNERYSFHEELANSTVNDVKQSTQAINIGEKLLGPGFAHENLSQLKEPTPFVAMSDLQSPQDLFFSPVDIAASPDNNNYKHNHEENDFTNSKKVFPSSPLNINDLQNQPISKESSEILERISSFFPKDDSPDVMNNTEINNSFNNTADGWRSPSEYALHIVFTKFVRYTDALLSSCLQDYSENFQQEPPIIDILGPERNAEFDRIIDSLGYIAKGNIKPVIDAMMFWRKAKSQNAADASLILENLLKQNDINLHDLSDLHSSNTSFSDLNPFNRIKKRSISAASKNSNNLSTQNSNDVYCNKNMEDTNLKTKKTKSLTRRLTHKALGIRSFSITSKNNKKKKEEEKMAKDDLKSLSHKKNLSKFSINSLNDSQEDDKRKHSNSINDSSNNDSINESLDNSKANLTGLTNKIEAQRNEVFILERKSIISIYILSRVLIEIVKQCEMNQENSEYLLKLEDIVFQQLKNTNPLMISHSTIRTTNWDSFAELLGWISDKSFLSVSDKFVSALEKLPERLSSEEESKAQLLILDMRYLKLKNYPLENFEECGYFVQSIAKFFSKTKNEYVRLAYAEVLTQILLPLSGVVSAEVNHPVWVETINIILKTCNNLIKEPKWWSNISKLIVATLCVAPQDVFTNIWFKLIEQSSVNIHLKTTEEKTTFAVGLSRLVWVYLFRCPESLNNTEKKLSKLFKLFVSPDPKNSWLVVDPILLNALVDMVTAISYHHKNFVFENVLLVIMANQSQNYNSLEKFDFDQLFILINAFRGLVVTNKEIPDFPIKENREYDFKLDDIVFPVSQGIKEEYEDISDYIYKLFVFMDNTCGTNSGELKDEHNKPPVTSFQNISGMFSNISNSHNLHGQGNHYQSSEIHSHERLQSILYLLFSHLIKTMPCCCSINSKIPLKQVIEILSRNAIHREIIISEAAGMALNSLASKANPYTLITWFSKYSFDFDELITSNTHDLSYLNSSEYKRLLFIYVKLLTCWLESYEESINELSKKAINTNDMMNFHLRDPEYETFDEDDIKEGLQQAKNTCAVIDEVEGNGLFFLCSYSPAIRQLGVYVLKIVCQFDELLKKKGDILLQQSIRLNENNEEASQSKDLSHFNFFAENGTRVMNILENCNFYSLIPSTNLNKFNAAEKQRLQELTGKQNNNILLKIVSSTDSVDSSLWIRSFPKLLDVVFNLCPMAMALCRSIVCIRLAQLHDVVLDIASRKHLQRGIVPENVISQWKVYLIVACSLLTSTVIKPNTSQISKFNHEKKKSQQVFSVQHQKITSATSVFKMVLPMLNTKNTMVKNAIISGLSSININIFGAFLESVEKILCSWKFESGSNIVRIEIFHILTSASVFFEDSLVYNDKKILKMISVFLQNAKTFLNDTRVQNSLTFQPLRLYFSEMLGKFYQALLKRSEKDINEFLPFEGRISCFNYLMEWCNYGEYKRLCQQRYDNIIKSYSGSRDYKSIQSSVDFYKAKLEKSNLETMVQLLNGSIQTENVIRTNDVSIKATTIFNIDDLMSWIKILFSDSDEKIRDLGCQALTNLLNYNRTSRKLYDIVLKECFYNCIELDITELYYTTIIKSLLNESADDASVNNLVISEEDAVTLGLFGIVNKRREVRSYAIDLLSKVEQQNHDSAFVKVFKERLSNDSRFMFKNTSVNISNVFAELPSDEKRLVLFSKICFIVELLNIELKADLVALLIPWVTKIELKNSEDIDTYMTLNNMMAITAMCNDFSPTEIEQLWVSLAKGNSFQNFNVIIDFILQSSLSSRNPKYVEMCRDVVMYLSTVPGGSAINERLIADLDTRNTIPNNQILFKEPEGLRERYSDILDVARFLPHKGKDVYFSKCHLSIIFLVNLLGLNHTSLEQHIPLLLHVCLIFLDHYVPIIQESAVKILCNLIYILNPAHEETEFTVSLIKDKNQLWAYNQLVKDNKGSRSPKTMDIIIKNILTIVGGNVFIQECWQRIACRWATLCAVRHIACRSFQVFRCLIIVLDLKMLKEMLHRLANTICDDNTDVQGFSMQILMSFNAMTAELSPEKLIEFPQLFWALVACLSTIHEQEYIEVLSSLNKFVSKIDLDSPDTIQCLGATFPVNWEGQFDGLQSIIMTGLRSSNAYKLSLELLNKLNLLGDSKIIANTENRILYALLANLPNFLRAFDDEQFLNEIASDCDGFIKLCDSHELPSLSRLINSLKNKKFRSKKDFISQVTGFINRTYMEKQAGSILIFLVGLLLNKDKTLRSNILAFLQHFFTSVDLNKPEFIHAGADLISPILNLLLTDLEHEALDVINSIPFISGNEKTDKDILRISLGDKSIKNDYNTVPTLYGLPDEVSGWCVPMPVITASDTRANVQAVYTTCHIKVNVDRVNVKNPNYEEPPNSTTVEQVVNSTNEMVMDMGEYADEIKNNTRENTNAVTGVISTISEEDEEAEDVEMNEEKKGIKFDDSDVSLASSVKKNDMNLSNNASYSAIEEVSGTDDDEDILSFMPLLKHIIREDEEEEEDDIYNNKSILEASNNNDFGDFEEEGRRMMLLYEHFTEDNLESVKKNEDYSRSNSLTSDIYGEQHPKRSLSVNRSLNRNLSRTSTDTVNKYYGGISYSNNNKTSHLFDYYNNANNSHSKTNNDDVGNTVQGKDSLTINTNMLPVEKKKRTKMSEKLKRKPYRLNTRVISPMSTSQENDFKSTSSDMFNKDHNVENDGSGFKGRLGISNTPKKSTSSSLEKSKGYSSPSNTLSDEAYPMNKIKSGGFSSKLEMFNSSTPTNTSNNSLNLRLQTGTQTVAHKLSSSRLNIFNTPKNLSHSGSSTSLGTGLFTTPNRPSGYGNRNSGVTTNSSNTITNGNNQATVFNSPNSLSHMWTELDNLDSFFTKTKDD
ncbi:hypothetical protein ACO0R3_004193 [Hanseniaspora guilliermondii]